MSIPPPDVFSWKKPEEWEKWIKRFDRYLIAAAITDDVKKVNTLIYCMGSQAEDALLGLNISTDDMKKYQTVKDKFDSHFIVKRNYIFERAKFNKRCQLETEPIETFLAELYNMVENCNYGPMKEELLRDRIVVGISDNKLSERLQLDADLTLKKTVDQVRTTAMVHKQSLLLREPPIAQTDAVKYSQKHQMQKKKWSKDYLGNGNKKTVQNNKCQRCGKSPNHNRESCPAKGAKCTKCSKIGHWWRMCRSDRSAVHEIELGEADDVEDPLFLGSISTTDEGSINANDWTIELSVNDKPLIFKVDTGADVTVISMNDYKTIAPEMTMNKPDRVLLAANTKPLNVKGFINCKITSSVKASDEKIYVVQNLKTPLLGKPAINSLEIISFAESIDSNAYKQHVIERFPKLFRGLGQVKDFEYTIKLDVNARPFAISSPRRVAIPLLPAFRCALDTKLKDGVIRQLGPNEVSEWCCGVVVVPKSDGEVRICADLTNLNKFVLRPRCQLPTVDSTLAKLNNAKIFTKLDANSGFYQVPLSRELQILTTFVTPFGRFCYTRLPFGISSGPEIFQDQMRRILDGLPHVNCQIDDILLDSETIEDHEKYLIPTLQRLHGAGITLNAKKCEFLKDEVRFVGHRIGPDGISADSRKVEPYSRCRPLLTHQK